MKYARAVVLGWLLTVSGFATAAERGFYFSAGAGRVEYDVEANQGMVFIISSPLGGFVRVVPPDYVRVGDEELGWNGTVGYRINKYVAAELAYMDFGTVDVSEQYTVDFGRPFTPATFVQRYSIGITGPAVSVLGSLPVGAGFDIFARGGVLFADKEVTMRGAVNAPTFGSELWLAGAGVDWSFARRWAARLEYMRSDKTDADAVSGKTDVSQFSASVLFRL